MKNIFIITAFILTSYVYSQPDKTPLYLNSAGEITISHQQPQLLNNTNGDQGGRFDFSIYFFPDLNIGGAGKYLGSEIELFDETVWEQALPDDVLFDIRTDYGDRIVPVTTRPEPDIPFHLNLVYTLDDARFGFSWFRMSASYEQSGEVPGLYFFDDDLSEGFGYGFVSFWDMGWDLHSSRNFPASWVEGFRDLGEIDEYEEPDEDYVSEYFPDQGLTQWEASHDISFNSFQLSVQYPVIKNENLSLSLKGGLQYGRWSDNLMQSVNMQAYIKLTDRWVQMIEIDQEEQDSILVEVFWDDVFDNDITLKTNSSSEFNSFGLLAGIEAAWKVTPELSFAVNAGSSTLSGNATFSGSGIDIDDIIESDIITIYDMEGNLLFEDPLEGYEYLSGEFDLPEYSQSVLSVNYYLNVMASYEITSYISLMAGYSYSLWKDLPMAPQWSYSDEFTKPYGPFAVEQSWDKKKKSNISASGFKLGIGFRF